MGHVCGPFLGTMPVLCAHFVSGFSRVCWLGTRRSGAGLMRGGTKPRYAGDTHRECRWAWRSVGTETLFAKPEISVLDSPDGNAVKPARHSCRTSPRALKLDGLLAARPRYGGDSAAMDLARARTSSAARSTVTRWTSSAPRCPCERGSTGSSRVRDAKVDLRAGSPADFEKLARHV